jgi:hypothetical protein
LLVVSLVLVVRSSAMVFMSACLCLCYACVSLHVSLHVTMSPYVCVSLHVAACHYATACRTVGLPVSEPMSQYASAGHCMVVRLCVAPFFCLYVRVLGMPCGCQVVQNEMKLATIFKNNALVLKALAQHPGLAFDVLKCCVPRLQSKRQSPLLAYGLPPVRAVTEDLGRQGLWGLSGTRCIHPRLQPLDTYPHPMLTHTHTNTHKLTHQGTFSCGMQAASGMPRKRTCYVCMESLGMPGVLMPCITPPPCACCRRAWRPCSSLRPTTVSLGMWPARP